MYVLVLFCLRLTTDLGTLGGFIVWLNIIWPNCKRAWETSLRKLPFVIFLTLFLGNCCCHCSLYSMFHQEFRIANLIIGSSVQVLVTLMYISYSDLLSISLLVLTPSYIYCNSTNGSSKLLVWFSDGSVLYGQNPFHIALLCVSIAVLSLFILPFTLIGLLELRLWGVKYFHPLIDVIHGPHKENLRYWFGLRLMIKSLVYIVNAVLQGSNMTLQLVLSFIILGLFAFVEAAFLYYLRVGF